MYSEENIKAMMEMFTDPLFKKGFVDFFGKMQMEGIDAAKKFWSMHPEKSVFSGSPDFFEKMVDFYILLGFVPYSKFEEAVKDNEKLKKEVEFLRNTLKELQQSVFVEGTKKSQDMWKTVVDKQFEINKDMAKNFFELFKELK